MLRRWTLALPVALGAGAACGPPSPAPAPAAQSGAASPPAASLAMPGPARGRLEQAVIENEACERCHAEQAREWRASLHRRADLEPSYRRAFAIEPMPFCRGCHAPEAVPDEPESDAVAAIGVGCVTCHVTNAGVLAAPFRGPGAPPPAPHAITRDARFAGDAACASCHEFGFPGTPGKEPPEKMQWTVTEHARGAAAATSCAGCHMPSAPRLPLEGAAHTSEGPAARGGRSHLFAASRDPAMLASAVRIAAERIDATRVRVVLSPGGAGHAFPTGDLFRRIEVLAEAEGPDHMSLGSDVHYLGRHFDLRAHSAGRRLVRDDRVHGEPVTVVLDVGAAGASRPIAYRVAYQRVDHPNGTDARDAAVDGEVVLAQGLLPPPPSNLSLGKSSNPLQAHEEERP